MDQPQYRLRIDEIRVFYDVTETRVEVLAIVPKAQAEEWLDQEAIRSSPGGAGQVKDDLSRYLKLAADEEIVITRHGRPAAGLSRLRNGRRLSAAARVLA